MCKEREGELHDSRQVANEFLRLAKEHGKPLTPLQVQKLVYYAHAWMLGLYGQPLIDTKFEAWRYGPVVPVIYFGLSHYRGDPIKLDDSLPLHHDDENNPFTEEESDIIAQVYERYARFSGLQLSAMTHGKGTPWDKSVKNGDFLIPNKLIRKYYADLAKQALDGR